MNHGYCKNCWWWKYMGDMPIESLPEPFKQVRENMEHIKEPIRMGRCWMEIGDGQLWKMTHETAYCPDYANRKKDEKKYGTLDEFIEKSKKQ